RGEINRELISDAPSRIAALKSFVRHKAGDARARGDLLRSAQGGDVMAQMMLAKTYFEQEPREIDLAMHWNFKAAEQGDPGAQVQYAKTLLLLKGDAAAAEAIVWWTRAANQGEPEAQFHLGEALYQGKFVGKDMVAAGQWILLAADAGHAEARHLL